MNVKWISHRGESADAPENTCPAFQLSLERKTDGMECDVRLTKDQYLVVGHDGDTSRGGDMVKVIAESTLEELQQVNLTYGKDAYKNIHMPLFADTLQYLGEGREYYVELKTDAPAQYAILRDAIESAGIPWKQIIFISFSYTALKECKIRIPEAKTLFLCNPFRDDNGPVDDPAGKLIAKLKDLHADGVDSYADDELFTADFVKQMKDAGYFVAVWTIDQEERAARFIEMGVDSVTSNRAAALRDALQG